MSDVVAAAEKKKPNRLAEAGFEGVVTEGIAIGLRQFVSVPFKTLQTVLEASGELVRQGIIGSSVQTIRGCYNSLVENGGLRALWRPYLPLLGVGVVNYIFKLAFYDYSVGVVKNWFVKKEDQAKKISRDMKVLAATMLTGITTLFTLPFAYVSVRLSCDVTRRFSGVSDVLSTTYNKVGLLGIYATWPLGVAGVLLYRLTYNGLHHLLAGRIPEKYKDDRNAKFAFKCFLRIIAGLVTTPLHVITCRMMLATGEETEYSNPLECAQEIANTEGLPGFFNGALTSILAMIVASIALEFIGESLLKAPKKVKAAAKESAEA